MKPTILWWLGVGILGYYGIRELAKIPKVFENESKPKIIEYIDNKHVLLTDPAMLDKDWHIGYKDTVYTGQDSGEIIQIVENKKTYGHFIDSAHFVRHKAFGFSDTYAVDTFAVTLQNK